jgi:uncharacterized protein (DUF58 family)
VQRHGLVVTALYIGDFIPATLIAAVGVLLVFPITVVLLVACVRMRLKGALRSTRFSKTPLLAVRLGS